MVAKIETQIVYKRRTTDFSKNLKEKELNCDNISSDQVKSQKSVLFNLNNNEIKNLMNSGNEGKPDNLTVIKTTVEDDLYDITLPAKIGTDFTFKRKIVWFNAIGFLVLHILGIIGMALQIAGYTKGWTNLYSLLLTIGTGMGITMGAHRLFSHRSYKAKTWLRVTLLLLHTMVGQNCLYVWARDHRQHHKYSDTDADPHNATRGFFFSHIGWLMSKKHPKVIEYGKKIDMSDLEADPWVMFQKRYYKTLYTIFTLLIPTAIPCLLWGEDPLLSLFSTFFGRTILQLNFTWSVNSVAHMFGNKPYDKNILPVESKFVSMFAGGEGWHNYHHAFPWDYRAAELGMPWNLSTTLIDWLASKGQVYDRKCVTDSMLKSRILRTGDGSHPKYGIDGLSNEIPENKEEKDNKSDLNATPILSTLNDDQKDPLRKYIVDKKQVNSMLDQLESTPKIDGMNNNEMTDFNGNVGKGIKGVNTKSKQMLNVPT